MTAPVRFACSPILVLGFLASLQPNTFADTPQPAKAQIHQTRVLAAAISPDGKNLAAAGEDGVILRDLPGGKELRRLSATRGFSRLTFSPDGTLLAAALPSLIYLWEVGSGKLLQQWSVGNGLHAVGFSADGSTVTVVYNRERIRTWGVADGKELASPWKIECQILSIVAISPDGGSLATIDQSRTLRLATTGGRESVVAVLPDKGCSLSSLAFSANSKVLAAAGDSVVVWESATGKELARFATNYFRAPRTLALSPDGKTLASPGTDGFPWDRTAGFAVIDKAGFFVRIRDVSTGRELRRLALPPIEYNGGEPVWGLNFAPDGSTLLGLRNDTIYLWDVRR
jgi:WD40 repeat protein